MWCVEAIAYGTAKSVDLIRFVLPISNWVYLDHADEDTSAITGLMLALQRYAHADSEEALLELAVPKESSWFCRGPY